MIDYMVPLALLSVLAMLFVLVPLWRLRAKDSAQTRHVREEKNRELFAQRQQELEQEVGNGTIAPEDFQRMVAESQRAFLTDMQDLQTAQTASSPPKSAMRWLPMVLALMIPVVAGTIYYKMGSAPDLALPALMTEVDAAKDKAGQTAALNKLAAVLSQRLQRRPGDLQNGYLLGTLYLGLERYADAAKVFEQMLGNMKPNPDRATVLGQLAQARYLLAGSSITPEVQATMDEALALNPNEQSVMGLYAIEAFLKRDFVNALKYWRRQLSSLPPDSSEAQQLHQRIAVIEANLPEDQKAAALGPHLTVVIKLAPELAAKVSQGMRLFVYARNPAMPMPIVAQNLAVPEFPFTLTLDNTMSMTGMQLESVPELVVGARLSRSGTAKAESGDFETLSEPFQLKDQSSPLTLTINSVVP